MGGLGVFHGEDASHTEKYRFSATSYPPAGLIRNGRPSGTPRSSNPSPRSANRELNSRMSGSFRAPTPGLDG